MLIYTENGGDSGLPRNIFIRFLIFLTLIGMSAVVMKPLQTALQMGMSQVRKNVIEKIEDFTGMEVYYSSIRPTIFGSFDIRDLNILKNGETVLSASRTKISFSIFDLLRGKKSAFHTIQIEKPVLNLDMESDADIIRLISSISRTGAENEMIYSADKEREIFNKIAEFFPDKTNIKIRDCYLHIRDGGFAYKIENMNMDISGNRELLSLNGEFGAEVKNTGIFKISYGVKTGVGINGTYSPNLEEGSAELVFSSFAVSHQETKKESGVFFTMPVRAAFVEDQKEFLNVQSLAFALDFKDRLLSLKTSGESECFKGAFEYNTFSGRMSAEADCNKFKFSDIFIFTDSRGSFNHLLSLPVDGKAYFTHEKNTGLIRYDVDFRGGETAKSADSFAIRVNGSEKAITIHEFWLNASSSTAKAGLFQGRFSVKGNMGIDTLTPSGTVVFDRFSLTGDEYFDAVFNVSSSRKEIAIKSVKAAAGKSVLNDVEFFLYPSQNDLGFVFSALDKNEERVGFDATFNYKPRQFDASLSLSSLPVLDLLELFRPFTNNIKAPPAAKLYLYDTFISADVFFTTDFSQFVYNAPNVRVKSGETEGVFSFSGTDRQFSLSEGVFNADKDEFLVSAQVNFSNPQDFVFTANASYLDYSWHLEGQILDKTTLIIRDPNGLHAYGSISNSGAISGYLEGISFPFPIHGQPVFLNFYTTLRYTSKDFWSLDVAKFEALNIRSAERNEFLKISGFADQDGASFRDIVFSDNTGILAGSADCAWDRDFSFVNFIVTMTDGRESGELYNIDGRIKDKRVNINAAVSDMRVDRFLVNSRPVHVSAEALISWDSINSFSANVNLNSLFTKLEEFPLNVSANLEFTNDDLNINDLKFKIAEIYADMPSLQVSRTDGFANAGADVHGFLMKRWIDGKIRLDANFGKINSWAEIWDALNSINGSINVNDLWYDSVQYNSFDVAFANNDGNITVSGGPGNMLRLEMDKEGDFFAGLAAPFPIHASIAGKFDKGYVDAHCNDFFIDLSALWKLVPPVPDFAFSGGYATAKVDVRGHITNPEFYGSGRGSSIRMIVPNYVKEEIKTAPFNVELNGSEMSFGPFQVMSGKGIASATGLFIFEKWVPDNFLLDIKMQKENPIPFILNVNGFLASGDASGDLQLNLEKTLLDVSGNLYGNNMELGINFTEYMNIRTETKTETESKVTATVNVAVTTGPAVEFVWPNTSMPILRANAENGTELFVSVDTITGQYTINTDIKIRSGEINYFDRNFYIRQGNLVFRENEMQFSPRLTARAEIRDRTDTGPVTISMIIDNEPLLSFVPRFEANPLLTQYEIYALLGQNMYFPGGGERIDAAQLLLTSTSDILGQFIGLRTFERIVRNGLKLDMFSIRTKFLQNAVSSGARAVGIVEAPVDRNSHVGNYFDNTTVFVGKYIGQSMFFQGMLSLVYDENNLKYGGLKPELDFGIELQSPFFNIRWDFYPYHPENWWVTDNSITLTWSKSF